MFGDILEGINSTGLPYAMVAALLWFFREQANYYRDNTVPKEVYEAEIERGVSHSQEHKEIIGSVSELSIAVIRLTETVKVLRNGN